MDRTCDAAIGRASEHDEDGLAEERFVVQIQTPKEQSVQLKVSLME